MTLLLNVLGDGGATLDAIVNHEDRTTILFCGSKKSVATGEPMAQVLFAGSTIGVLILTLMLFHQIQLMVCSVLAQCYAKRPEPGRI